MRTLLFILSFLLVSPASAHDSHIKADLSSIRTHVAEVLRNSAVDAVNPTPISGLFEVQSGRNIFYSDADGSHLIVGAHIIDSIAKKDLTKARQEQLNRVDWKLLPLDKAVISGDKKASLKVAIFTDPECPYCRKFEVELAKLKGVKIYNFLYPLSFHKHAKRWSTAIWCAKERHKMMVDIMVNNSDPAAGSCDTPLAEIETLGKKLGISGTPTLISGDGRLSAGGKSVAELKAWLQESKPDK
ncbi:MAG: DsbC family protein [Mariprofundus sp.]|nr:DsbC family protein [Mariprofundus sp.]